MSASGNNALIIPDPLPVEDVSSGVGTSIRDDVINLAGEPSVIVTVSGGDSPDFPYSFDGLGEVLEASPDGPGNIQEYMELILISEQRQEKQLEAVLAVQVWFLVCLVLYGLYKFLRIFI